MRARDPDALPEVRQVIDNLVEKLRTQQRPQEEPTSLGLTWPDA